MSTPGAGLTTGGSHRSCPGQGGCAGSAADGGTDLIALWRGHRLTLPRSGATARGDLMLALPSTRGEDECHAGWRGGSGYISRRVIRRALALADRGDDDGATERPGDRDEGRCSQYGNRGRAHRDWMASAVRHCEREPFSGNFAAAEQCANRGARSPHGSARRQIVAGGRDELRLHQA